MLPSSLPLVGRYTESDTRIIRTDRPEMVKVRLVRAILRLLPDRYSSTYRTGLCSALLFAAPAASMTAS